MVDHRTTINVDIEIIGVVVDRSLNFETISHSNMQFPNVQFGLRLVQTIGKYYAVSCLLELSKWTKLFFSKRLGSNTATKTFEIEKFKILYICICIYDVGESPQLANTKPIIKYFYEDEVCNTFLWHDITNKIIPKSCVVVRKNNS